MWGISFLVTLTCISECQEPFKFFSTILRSFESLNIFKIFELLKPFGYLYLVMNFSNFLLILLPLTLGFVISFFLCLKPCGYLVVCKILFFLFILQLLKLSVFLSTCIQISIHICMHFFQLLLTSILAASTLVGGFNLGKFSKGYIIEGRQVSSLEADIH